MEKKIIVIGGGPGGYVAAIRAAQLGAKVSLIEKDKVGGTCLNRGCIPTKALYRNAELLNNLKHMAQFGIQVEGYTVEVAKVQERKQEVVEQLVGGIEQLLQGNGVEVIHGAGTLKDKNTVIVTATDGTIQEKNADNIIIAAGSSPTLPNIPGIELEGVVTSEQMLNFTEVPKRLVVVGGGVIGMEFAGIFNAMGSEVTVIEFLPSILAQVDTDLTKRLTPSLKKKGIQIHTNTKVNSIERKEGTLVVYAEGKKGEISVEADAVLVSTGRTPVIEGLGLSNVGIEVDRKGIQVNENYETNISGIYAIGDINGKNMLAHAASHQGKKVAEKIMGVLTSHEEEVIPSCIFIFPEIACVGMTEQEAKAAGMNYKVSKFLFGANGKALTLGEGEGMVKVIGNAEDHTLLGVHIMGPHASDLIHEGVLAVTKKIKVEDIASIVHAHPTLSEAFEEAVLGLVGEAIHMVPSRRK